MLFKVIAKQILFAVAIYLFERLPRRSPRNDIVLLQNLDAFSINF